MSTKEKLKYYLSSDGFKTVKYICIGIYIIWMLLFAVNLKLDFFYKLSLSWLFYVVTCGIAVVILGYAVFTFFLFGDKNCEERKRLRRNIIITLALSLVLNLITAICLIRSESFFINFFVYYLFSAIVAIYVSPMLIMLWNEIVSLARRESQGIKILSAVLFTAGLFMIVLEYILLLCAIFMPTGSDFVVTDTMIIAYNLFPAGLLAAAAPIKLFS